MVWATRLSFKQGPGRQPKGGGVGMREHANRTHTRLGAEKGFDENENEENNNRLEDSFVIADSQTSTSR